MSGASLRNIAKQFAVSATALHRHKDHIPQQLAEAKEAVATADAGDLLAAVKGLLVDAQRITKHAEQARQFDTALRGVRECREVLELFGRVSSEVNAQRQAEMPSQCILPRTREEVERKIAELLDGGKPLGVQVPLDGMPSASN